jgi:GNAT superfamily N-acetyltransferase
LTAAISDDNFTTLKTKDLANAKRENDAHRPHVKISTVRDYRDRYILSVLQREAIRECPGFRELREGEMAKIIWIESEKGWIPGGYYIFSRRCTRQIRHSDKPVVYPMTLHQIFVVPAFRGLGLGTMMLRDFIAKGNRRTVWVESPFDVTKHILTKLGFAETNKPYKLWQMMEGLSKWEKISSMKTRKTTTGESNDIERHHFIRSREEFVMVGT